MLTKKNLRKLRKHPGAAKWVGKLGQLIKLRADWENEPPDWVNELWDIILSLDKTGKQYLKNEACADKAREKRKQKKAKKKAPRKASKKAGKKVNRDSQSTSSSSNRSDNDGSTDSSSSNSDPAPKRYSTNSTTGSTTNGMPEFKVLNGRHHFKSQGGKGTDCGAPPSKP